MLKFIDVFNSCIDKLQISLQFDGNNPTEASPCYWIVVDVVPTVFLHTSLPDWLTCCWVPTRCMGRTRFKALVLLLPLVFGIISQCILHTRVSVHRLFSCALVKWHKLCKLKRIYFAMLFTCCCYEKLPSIKDLFRSVKKCFATVNLSISCG